MRRSKSAIYLHFVWATRNREPLLVPAMERMVYRCVQCELETLGCAVLAIGGLADHVHVVVRAPAIHPAAHLAKQAKGVSSRLAKRSGTGGQPFGWQEGYGVFSISESHLPSAIEYVRSQKDRHASGQIRQDWEETDEDAAGSV